jgi:carbon-monoxide dehydrogenase medium subunit
VQEDGSGLRFGALATLRQIEQEPAVRDGWPLLTEAIGCISSIQTKVMGTAVGNLCVGTPASDVAPALCALGARVSVAGPDGTAAAREIPLEELFVDAGRTVLAPHEIVSEVFVPKQQTGTVCAFLKLSKTSEDIAKVNVAVAVTMTQSTCLKATIALGSVGPIPLRATVAEEALRERMLDSAAIAEAAELAAGMAAPISDVRSSAAYRKEMVRVLVHDALERTVARALGPTAGRAPAGDRSVPPARGGGHV